MSATARVIATVTSKGQVTIPVAIRRRLGVDGGGPVSFTENSDGTITLLPARKPTLTELLGNFDPDRHRHAPEERVWDDAPRGRETL